MSYEKNIYFTRGIDRPEIALRLVAFVLSVFVSESSYKMKDTLKVEINIP